MTYMVRYIFYTLLTVTCPVDSKDNSCFTIEVRDTAQKEFKTKAAAKGFITKGYKKLTITTVEGKALIDDENGFYELKLDSL